MDCNSYHVNCLWFVILLLNMTIWLRFFLLFPTFSTHDSDMVNLIIMSCCIFQVCLHLLFLDVNCWPYKSWWSFICTPLLLYGSLCLPHCFITNMGQWVLPVQKCLSSVHYRNMFSTIPVAIVFGSGVFYWLTVHSKGTDLIPQLPLPSSSSRKSQVISQILHT